MTTIFSKSNVPNTYFFVCFLPSLFAVYFNYQILNQNEVTVRPMFERDYFQSKLGVRCNRVRLHARVHVLRCLPTRFEENHFGFRTLIRFFCTSSALCSISRNTFCYENWMLESWCPFFSSSFVCSCNVSNPLQTLRNLRSILVKRSVHSCAKMLKLHWTIFLPMALCNIIGTIEATDGTSSGDLGM